VWNQHFGSSVLLLIVHHWRKCDTIAGLELLRAGARVQSGRATELHEAELEVMAKELIANDSDLRHEFEWLFSTDPATSRAT
jgi:hypothetical protein